MSKLALGQSLRCLFGLHSLEMSRNWPRRQNTKQTASLRVFYTSLKPWRRASEISILSTGEHMFHLLCHSPGS